MPIPCSSSECNIDEQSNATATGVYQAGKASAIPVVAAGGDVGVEPPAETPLPIDEVMCILAQKPHPIRPPADEEHLRQFYPPEMIARIMDTEREAAVASEAIQNEFFTFQAWARKEFEEKGVVMVDDEFLARRDQTCQWLKEEFAELFDRMENEFTDSDFGNDSDVYATDDDDNDDKEEEAFLEY